MRLDTLVRVVASALDLGFEQFFRFLRARRVSWQSGLTLLEDRRSDFLRGRLGGKDEEHRLRAYPCPGENPRLVQSGIGLGSTGAILHPFRERTVLVSRAALQEPRDVPNPHITISARRDE